MPLSYALPDWTLRYIGIPFRDHGRDHKGCDCWGLCRLILAEQMGLSLPSFGEGYGTAADGAGVAGLLTMHGTSAEDWRTIPPGEEQLGDVVLMSGLYRAGRSWVKADMHVGLVLASDVMIHVERGIDAALGLYARDRRLRSRVRGFWRPRGLDGE